MFCQRGLICLKVYFIGKDMYIYLLTLLYLVYRAIKHSSFGRSILRQLSNASFNRCIFKVQVQVQGSSKDAGGSGRTDIGCE